jgi:opacity protein-like surface antigen
VPSLATGATASKWNLAWAVHAGLAYKVNPSLTLELAYRYVDLGDG